MCPHQISTVVQSGCQLFRLSVVKLPNDRHCKDYICIHLVSPENNPFHILSRGVIPVADTLERGQGKRREV